MQLPKSQHKIMLFNARLVELERTKEAVANGRIGYSEGSKKNRNFELRLDAAPPGTDHEQLLNVDKLSKHSAARKPQLKKSLKDIDQKVCRLFPDKFPGGEPVSSDSVSLQKFAEAIGFKDGRWRYIIDYIHASELPTYSAVAQPSGNAERFTDKFGGLYFLYRHDLNDLTKKESDLGLIIRATLSIRYPVPFKPYDADRDGESRIRCKRVIPYYGAGSRRRLAYDGYLGPKGEWHQFLFQARRFQGADAAGAQPDDLILMYTEDLPDVEGERILTRGVMLTQNQETRMTPTVSDIVIVRQKEYRMLRTSAPGFTPADTTTRHLQTHYQLAPKDEREFMDEKARAFQPGDPEVAEAALEFVKGWNPLNTSGLHR